MLSLVDAGPLQARTVPSVYDDPCGKQHFREIPTPDFVRTLRQYHILNSMLDSYIYLQNPAWVFRGNVVSHMDDDALAQPHVIFVNGLAQSGVGKSRKCCFPHGPFYV